ncbi:MAG: dihydroxyacetone kinase subunit DhaL [Chloroflexi bacterium]|nr:dihydroxyacetone kinase subunit DhaL [Chloroflexota bacterium]
MADGSGPPARIVIAWLRLAAGRVAERRDELTDLDAAIGDGDHGINLDRGMAAVLARLDRGELPVHAPGPLLVATGRTLLGTVGGASGALYGRAFMLGGERLATDRPSSDDPAAAVDAAVAAIAALGRSRPGEKTMLDALVPAAAAFRAVRAEGAGLAVAAEAAAGAAEAGALATIPMLATKGRASYLGERSIGHLDPGAASAALLARALADALSDA